MQYVWVKKVSHIAEVKKTSPLTNSISHRKCPTSPRQAAKSIVACGVARRAIVQVSYAIGVPDPLSVFVDTYGTGKIPDKEILGIVKENFDFRPGMISIDLDLKRGGNGRFLKTAAYGHFGRDDPDFTWEVVKDLKWDKPEA